MNGPCHEQKRVVAEHRACPCGVFLRGAWRHSPASLPYSSVSRQRHAMHADQTLDLGVEGAGTM